MDSHNISILGGGIGGLTTALALQQAGFHVKVYEAASEIRALGAGIMLASNANQALNKLGLWPALLKKGHIPDRISINDQNGNSIQQIDNQQTAKMYGFPTLTIHRADLQQLLLEELAPDTVVLGKKGKAVRQTGSQVHVQFEDGSEIKTAYLIAADGIHSATRKHIFPEVTPRYAGYTCWRGVTDQVPEGFDPTQFTESWGAKGRIGMVPLPGGKVYWFACIKAPQNDPKMAQYGPDELYQVFKDFHFPIPQIVQQTNNILWNDILDFKPIDQYAFDRIVLLGDAAHATTPNMGQGACQAIEGAVLLAHHMKKASSIEAAFKAYEGAKKDKAQWVVNNSWKFGKIAQLSSPILCGLRNFVLRRIPAGGKQLERLLTFDLS